VVISTDERRKVKVNEMLGHDRPLFSCLVLDFDFFSRVIHLIFVLVMARGKIKGFDRGMFIESNLRRGQRHSFSLF